MPSIVTQIIAAQPNVFAQFSQPDGVILELPVLVWAVIADENNGNTRIAGYSTGSLSDFGQDPDDATSNFIGYIRPSR